MECSIAPLLFSQLQQQQQLSNFVNDNSTNTAGKFCPCRHRNSTLNSFAPTDLPWLRLHLTTTTSTTALHKALRDLLQPTQRQVQSALSLKCLVVLPLQHDHRELPPPPQPLRADAVVQAASPARNGAAVSSSSSTVTNCKSAQRQSRDGRVRSNCHGCRKQQ